MRLIVDFKNGTLTEENGEESRSMELFTREAFEVISHLWLKVGWNEKYPYVFSWLGRPIIQLPEDIIRAQEVIYTIMPDVIIETGVAHGGSIIFYASLCKAIGKGRVVGVDIEIRPHNRQAIEAHDLFPYITLVEGNSVDPEVVEKVRSSIAPGEKTIVFLDSNHTKRHVMAELEAYHPLVSHGSYIVATDGIMKDLCDIPRGRADWKWDNPAEAAREFANRHPEFVIEQPKWPFNESNLNANVTHWPSAWLRRR